LSHTPWSGISQGNLRGNTPERNPDNQEKKEKEEQRESKGTSPDAITPNKVQGVLGGVLRRLSETFSEPRLHGIKYSIAG